MSSSPREPLTRATVNSRALISSCQTSCSESSKRVRDSKKAIRRSLNLLTQTKKMTEELAAIDSLKNGDPNLL